MITLKCHKCTWESSGYDPATMKTEYYSHLNAHEEAPHNGAFFIPKDVKKSAQSY